jgi:hypothetical protein
MDSDKPELGQLIRKISKAIESGQVKSGKTLSGLTEVVGLPTDHAFTRNIRFIFNHKEDILSAFGASQQVKMAKFKKDTLSAQAQVRQLMNEVHELEDMIHFSDSINEEVIMPKLSMDSTYKGKEATAVSVLSDVHFEEKVDPKVVYGINEYNPDIAAQRVEAYFTGLLKLIRKERQNVPITKLVLGLLGDNITGYIHEELMEDNWLSPTEATMGVRSSIMAGIKMLSEDGELDDIVIACCKGNHGRTSIRKKYSTGWKNSYEWMMYHDMKKIFEDFGGYDNLTWHIPKTELTYVDVYDKKIRFGHGDHFRFIGGVGGVAVPLMKWLYRSNGFIKADMTFIGHWHQQLKPASNCFINGAVIGYNAYAAGLGFIPEPPMQIFSLLDSERGFTINTPILL